MSRFRNINTTGLVTTATFASDDIREANLLRRAIMSEIETWAIDLVIFDVNSTAHHDEIVAHRLGMLVIDNEAFDPTAYLDETDQVRVRLDVTAPPTGGIFELTTANAFPTIPFAYNTPILSMLPGHRLACDVCIKQGTGDEHAKWRPVSIVGVNPADDTFNIRFKSVGMLAPQTILERGLDHLVSAARRPISTIFARPVIPATIAIQAEAIEE